MTVLTRVNELETSRSSRSSAYSSMTSGRPAMRSKRPPADGPAITEPPGGGTHGASLRRRSRLEPGDELLEPQLLEPAPDRVELGRAELDERAALLDELERLAQAGVAGVQAAD